MVTWLGKHKSHPQLDGHHPGLGGLHPGCHLPQITRVGVGVGGRPPHCPPPYLGSIECEGQDCAPTSGRGCPLPELCGFGLLSTRVLSVSPLHPGRRQTAWTGQKACGGLPRETVPSLSWLTKQAHPRAFARHAPKRHPHAGCPHLSRTPTRWPAVPPAPGTRSPVSPVLQLGRLTGFPNQVTQALLHAQTLPLPFLSPQVKKSQHPVPWSEERATPGLALTSHKLTHLC